MSDTEAWLEAVIKANDYRFAVAKVLSIEEHVLVGAGDNYLSQVKKIVARTVRGDGEIVAKSYILKELPSGVHTRMMILDGGYNFREFTCYRDVLSTMENLIKEKGLTDEPLWPQFISIKPYEKIILEDLTARGYKMADRHRGLDFDHCCLVMQNLAMFHALGLVLKERGALSKIAFGDHFLVQKQKVLLGWLDNTLKKLLTSMKNWGDEWQATANKLQNMLGTYSKDVIDLHIPKDGSLVVLAHADCWINNIIFRYNIYTGKPILMRFLDFQITCFSSFALDLTYFLVASPNLDVRRHHKRDLLKVYHDSLVFNMDRLGVTEKRPTFEDIESEMKRLAILNVHYMTTVLPIITLKKGDAMNVEDAIEKMKVATEAAAEGEEVNPPFDLTSEFDDNLVSIFKIILKDIENDL